VDSLTWPTVTVSCLLFVMARIKRINNYNNDTLLL
jgi:hypothetical protein